MLIYGFIFKEYLVFHTLALINCFTTRTCRAFLAHSCFSTLNLSAKARDDFPDKTALESNAKQQGF